MEICVVYQEKNRYCKFHPRGSSIKVKKFSMIFEQKCLFITK